MLTQAQVCTQIITGGISGLPACSGGLITANIFSLAGCVEILISNVGGSHPLAPGEIANFFQPVKPPAGMENHPAFLVPPDQRELFHNNKLVVVKFTFGEHVTQKEFIVTPRRANMIVAVASFINMTEQRIKVAFGGLKRIITHSVKVLNFRKKWRK